jgi:hypothetical protein
MEGYTQNPFKKIILAFAAFVFSFFVFPSFAHAASLYLSPSTGSYSAGATFTVGVYVSTTEAANAVSGSLSFSTANLEVSSLSTSGSIMSLWVQEPSYSNSAGSVNFEGVILNPGYTGTSGKVATITFKTKGSGTAAVSMPTGSVLANDGLGTNILSSRGSGSYTIGTAGEPPKEETPAPITAPPGAPSISSKTHPNPDGWYANSNPEFTWGLPRGVTGVNVLANQSAGTDPGTQSDGVMSRYTYTDVEDGTWYFHIRLQNEKGWGPVAHFKFQIDTVAPTPFTVSLPDGGLIKADAPTIRFETLSSDALSGISGYVFKVDGTEVARVEASKITEGGTFTLPNEASGEKTLVVEAFDQAGNKVETAPLPYTLQATEEPKEPLARPSSSFFSHFLNGLVAFAQYGVAGALMIVLLLSIAYVSYRVLKHTAVVLGEYHRYHKGGHSPYRRSLKYIHRGLGRDMVRLEKARRTRYLDEGSERAIRRLSKDIDSLRKDIGKEIDRL